MTDLYFKVLNPDRTPCHGGKGQWPEIGKWTKRIERLIPCQSGYHICRNEQILEWLKYGCKVYICEPDLDVLFEAESDKVIVQWARLTQELPIGDRELRLLAADCAEHVLHMYPDNKYKPRLLEALRITREFAEGHATEEHLAEPRRVAADAASATQAWRGGRASAGRAAAWAVWAAASAERRAVGAVSSDAGRAPAAVAAAEAASAAQAWGGGATPEPGLAAKKEERAWQYERLLRYAGIKKEQTVTDQKLIVEAVRECAKEIIVNEFTAEELRALARVLAEKRSKA